jgi:uncharacterized protein (DUF58 family)
MAARSTLAQLWAKADRPGVRAFMLSITALSAALLLALYSSAAAEAGQVLLAAVCALTALGVAGWVAVTLVPVLAKRTPLRWIGYKIEYRITHEGWIYISGVLLIALAALNTGNNLLFLILASLIAVILMSGFLSWITLSGVSLRLELPEHIFAGQTVRAVVELENEKITLPSFSLRVEAVQPKKGPAGAILETPAFFPYIRKQERESQSVPMTFPRRGLYRQEAFRIVTRFPFGFLQKARRLDLKTEAVVYPSVEPTDDLRDVLPGLQGAIESMTKGPGTDLYALRDYVATDSVRHVHWKASARSGSLMVREFTRDDDCRVLLVLDPHVRPPIGEANQTAVPGEDSGPNRGAEIFERAVQLCASLAWHFYERNALLQFRTFGFETPLAQARDIVFPILRHLALAAPQPANANEALMADLVAAPELFKLIVTGQPKGSIPALVWHSSYVIFVDELMRQ